MYDAKTIRTIEVEIGKPLETGYSVSICMDSDGYGIDEIC
jgi:hypothetical protein